MKTTDLVLLPATVHGIPSGNYDGSSLDWSGDRQPAANYYLSTGSLQTVTYRFNDFVGVVNIQATLDSDPTADSEWFTVLTIGDGTTPIAAGSGNSSQSITGNFTWLRANVTDFSAGEITTFSLSY